MGVSKRILCALVLLSLTAASTLSPALPLAAKESGQKKIALTFDDGPSAKYTGEILDILQQYKVKATFFVIGANAKQHPDLLQRIVDEGHEVGNHTYSHPHLQKISEAELAKELCKADALLQKLCGLSPTLFRPPEGVVSDAVKTAAQKKGYRLVLWSIDTRDWALNSVSNILRTVKKEASDGDIILFHDWVADKSPTPEALRQLLPWLLKEGFTCVTVSKL